MSKVVQERELEKTEAVIHQMETQGYRLAHFSTVVFGDILIYTMVFEWVGIGLSGGDT